MPTDAVFGRSCPAVFDAGLPPVAYEHAQTPEEAHHLIAQAREQSSIAMGQRGPEFLSYELVRAVLRDDRFITLPALGLDVQGITSGPVWDRACQHILNFNGERHRRLRRLVSKAFTPRAIARMQSLSAEIITELVDPLTHQGYCDVVSDIARRYPIPVICALLGTRHEDWQLFSYCIDDITKIFAWNVANDAPAIQKAYETLDAYFEGMIADRREKPTDDLMSDLIRAEDEGDHLTHSELLTLAVTLLGGGSHTTRNQLAAAVQVLCDHPDQWSLLAENPELAPAAVEELMRFCPIVFALARKAVVDIELQGVTIPAGTLVVANIAAAHRDPVAYDEPDCLDITRKNSAPMLGFSGGPHFCLGVSLARMELSEALKVITQRMPNPRRTGPTPWTPFVGMTGPIRLPIEFDPGH